MRALTGVVDGLDAEVASLEDVWPDDAGNEKELDLSPWWRAGNA